MKRRIIYLLTALYMLSLQIFAEEQPPSAEQNMKQAVQAAQTLEFTPVFPSEIKVKVLEMPKAPESKPEPKPKTYIASGYGYSRANSQTTLCCKYAGYVSRIYIYSGRKVKAGDVILEYDDLALRTKIEAAQNKIALQEKEIAQKTLQLQLKKLDPIPSAYRNTSQKQSAAKDKLEQLRNEMEVYERLHKDNIVSFLSYREKVQAYNNAKADYESSINDAKVVKSGLEKYYVEITEKDLEIAKTSLENMKRELLLLKEEQKYYKIVAPFDGVCKLHHDTVHGRVSEGSGAATIYRVPAKIVYAQFREADALRMYEGMKGVFRSKQYDKDTVYQVTIIEMPISGTSRGDNVYYNVKFKVDTEPKPLRQESPGVVELELPLE